MGEPPDKSGEPLYGLTPLPADESAGVEGPGSGVTDGLPEVGAVVAVFALFDGVADAPAVGAWPAQLAPGAGVCSELRPDVPALGLDPALAGVFAEAVSLALALPVGLALALAVGLALALALALALPVALPFGLALALTLPLGLTMSLLLCDGMAVLGEAVTLGVVGGVAGAVDRAVLDAAGFAEPAARDWDGDAHGAADGLAFPGDALPSSPLAPEARPVPPGPAELAVRLGEPANTSVLTWTNASRSGGTAASTTATANTATPMASAGRSIASRRSMGRACPGPAPRAGVLPRRGGAPAPRGALCSPRAPDKRRTRPARKPEPQRARLASSAAEAYTGPDLIFSRIRSRPSVLGSTWSAAACSDRRTNSANSSPGMPSGRWLRRVISLAPAPSAGRSCPGPCGSSPRRG